MNTLKLTQHQIDRINALYKDPETGKGILEGWGVKDDLLCVPQYETTRGAAFNAIANLTNALLTENPERHPLYVGELEGREVRKEERAGYCPFCIEDKYSHSPHHTEPICEAERFDRPGMVGYYWLAPPIAVEPEPMDEFEKWAERCSTNPDETAKEWQRGVGYALNQYRAIKRRESEKKEQVNED